MTRAVHHVQRHRLDGATRAPAQRPRRGPPKPDPLTSCAGRPDHAAHPGRHPGPEEQGLDLPSPTGNDWSEATAEPAGRPAGGRGAVLQARWWTTTSTTSAALLAHRRDPRRAAEGRCPRPHLLAAARLEWKETPFYTDRQVPGWSSRTSWTTGRCSRARGWCTDGLSFVAVSENDRPCSCPTGWTSRGAGRRRLRHSATYDIDGTRWSTPRTPTAHGGPLHGAVERYRAGRDVQAGR